jgi:hypothetical protein
MDSSWVEVSSESFLPKAEFLKALLEANEVDCMLLNQQDSAYHFGEIKLYVKREQTVKAINLIKNANE